MTCRECNAAEERAQTQNDFAHPSLPSWLGWLGFSRGQHPAGCHADACVSMCSLNSMATQAWPRHPTCHSRFDSPRGRVNRAPHRRPLGWQYNCHPDDGHKSSRHTPCVSSQVGTGACLLRFASGTRSVPDTFYSSGLKSLARFIFSRPASVCRANRPDGPAATGPNSPAQSPHRLHRLGRVNEKIQLEVQAERADVVVCRAEHGQFVVDRERLAWSIPC